MTTKEDATESVEDLYGQHAPATGTGQFFALKDGETKRVRFQSEPYVYRDNFKQPDGSTKVSTRYAWLLWNHDDGKAQIIKQSGTFYSSLAMLVKNPDFGNPVEYDIHIAREGTGTDTKYTVNGARKNIDLTSEALEQVAALDVTTDAKEDMLVPLRQYLKAGNKFPDEIGKDGEPAIRDLDSDNPLNSLDK